MLETSYAPDIPGAPAGVTDTLVRFAASLRFEDIPDAVVRRLKLHLLDTLGCAVAGRQLDVARSARQAGKAMGAGGACRVFGTAERFTPTAAAFANAVAANALDYDDGLEIEGKGLGHPGASVVASLLAAHDTRPRDGKAWLTAFAAAFEINHRLIYAMQPSAGRFREAYGVAQHQTVGACVAYALLRGLPLPVLEQAFGLAATLTCVPSLHKYNWRRRPIISLKDFVAPAAQGGVQAVLMAEAGLVGSRDVLDGEHGFWRMIGSDAFDPDVLVADLGRRWWTEHGSFKLYPACRWLASALEAFETLVFRHGIPAGDIVRIEVHTFGTIVDKLMDRRPACAIDAQFSLPYALAAIAHRLPKGPAWFDAATLASPALHSVADRVFAFVDPGLDEAMSGRQRRPGARVIVQVRSGAALVLEVPSPLGSRSRPAATDAIVAKFDANLASQGLDPGPVREMVLNLEKQEPALDWSALMT